jgi:hypothetical protein
MEDGLMREVVALFHSKIEFDEALNALMGNGFDPARFSLLASCEAIEAHLGHSFCKVSDMKDRPDVPRLAYIPDEDRKHDQNIVIGSLKWRRFFGQVAKRGSWA